ncbi:MAG: S24/S26 family peptidase [Clostridia bacterium]|nr:S24/S26 family peptidase [Clostridia bacterium]
MKYSLSITEWHEMALSGTPVSTRTLIHGISMFPSIRMDRDYVTIMPVLDGVEVGDIVLFDDPYQDRFVLHRVWRVDGDRVLTWGDNCKNPDREIPIDAVYGRVVLIERGKMKIHPDRKRGLALARFWHVFGRGYRFARRAVRYLKRRLMRSGKQPDEQQERQSDV